MKYTDIIKGINALLDGEMLTESQLLVHLDAVIDDINEALSSVYPNFTDTRNIPGFNGEYTHFPDRYVRGVVILGAAYKYYLTEEEGEMVAGDYGQRYQAALFVMKRDFMENVPGVFRDNTRGHFTAPYGASCVDPGDETSGYFGATAWVPNVFQGPEGPRGPRGFQGPQGPIGLTGLRGDQGIQGIQGVKGDKGDQGIQGIQGIQGLTGASIVEADFVDDDIVFTKDDNTTVVLSDAKIILKGEPGIDGVNGQDGQDGINGIDGQDGANFTILGSYLTLLALQTAHPTGEAGDAWAVGILGEQDIYLWDTNLLEWVNIGGFSPAEDISELTDTTNILGNRTYTENNYVTNLESLTSSIDALDIAVGGLELTADNVSIDDVGDYYTSLDVEGALQEVGEALDNLSAEASAISIEDVGAYYTSDNVEGALQEIGLDIIKAEDELLTAPIPRDADTLEGNSASYFAPQATTYTKTEVNNELSTRKLKNWIINGGFDVWQRGTSQTTSGYGSDDRWQNTNTGSTKTTSRQAFVVGQTEVTNNPTYFSRTVVSSVTGVSNLAFKAQRIEDVSKLAGKTVSLSFWAKADANKNITVEFRQDFGTGGSATVTSLGVQKFALTTSWQKFTKVVEIPSVSGKTIGADNYIQLTFWFDAGSNFNARTDSLGQQSGTFDIANVSLVEGSTPQEWQTEAYADVLRECQRYYVRYQSLTGTYSFCFAFPNSATAFSAIITLGLTLRTKPTSVEFNNIQIYSGTSGLTVSTIVLSSGGGADYVEISGTNSTGLTQYRPSALYATNTSGFLAFNAEL
jgi:hypothetical protein